ncbi:hypothetical protein TNIN_373871 [Trichonephila inaurata madagascariensis]|uniref:Uncharacterized protein n=1 Tax=Trichonephila inaurata madagascariensis TaxID=2747483 RepID=A0A8X6KLJ4_9ARAC|nr:hypothetical protein TNIN_373871 [Trichonephila inaurata madagascariensis]
MRCKRKVPSSRSAGPERKKKRTPIRETNKRVLKSSSVSTKQVKKRVKKTKENFGQVPVKDLRPGLEEGLLRSSQIQQGRLSLYNLQSRRDITRNAIPSGRSVQAQGDQSNPEEKHLVDQVLTPSIIIESPDNKVTKSLGRV